ncbi:GxxExxY protein [Maribellus mangrovi]|uniref:GxxExxY protein n=1 Tax=Maribellus mangrovi TaxID=3133146 RepID=UPI003F58D061
MSVHKEMGPGLLESVYEYCLMKEFELRGIFAENQVPVQLQYKGFMLGKDYRIDILVEREIVIELKAVEIVLPVHEAQIISHLKLTDKRLGFLINFNVPLLKEGFRRFVNKF